MSEVESNIGQMMLSVDAEFSINALNTHTTKLGSHVSVSGDLVLKELLADPGVRKFQDAWIQIDGLSLNNLGLENSSLETDAASYILMRQFAKAGFRDRDEKLKQRKQDLGHEVFRHVRRAWAEAVATTMVTTGSAVLAISQEKYADIGTAGAVVGGIALLCSTKRFIEAKRMTDNRSLVIATYSSDRTLFALASGENITFRQKDIDTSEAKATSA